MARKSIIALAALLLAATALPQDEPAPPKPAENKKAAEKKAAPKKIDVRVKVSVEDGGELPPDLRVQVSGQEPACGGLNANDASAAVAENGEALFRDLPVCKVAVKLNANRFLPVRAAVDLAAYKEPIPLTLERER
jgi:hypothetical protein